MIGLANPLRVYFWMLGQDARLGLLRRAGFEHVGPSLYRRGPLWIHQLGLSLQEGLLYSRADCRFYVVPPGSRPPEPPDGSLPIAYDKGWQKLRPVLEDYENWVATNHPDYRKRLLRICPPGLRPIRRKWRDAFTPVESKGMAR